MPERGEALLRRMRLSCQIGAWRQLGGLLPADPGSGTFTLLG